MLHLLLAFLIAGWPGVLIWLLLCGGGLAITATTADVHSAAARKLHHTRLAILHVKAVLRGIRRTIGTARAGKAPARRT
jgi:hypothetical protein